MKKINIRRISYHIRHKYLTLNNVVIAIAFIIAASWVWGSLGVMQRNYSLQKEVDFKKRQLQLAELETQSLELAKRYYQTREYQELAVREDLGLARAGERVLILPPNSEAAKSADTEAQARVTAELLPQSNFEQWTSFLLGGNQASREQ